MATNYHKSSRFLAIRDVLHTAVVCSMVVSWFAPPVSVAHAAEPAAPQTPDVPAYITQFQEESAAATTAAAANTIVSAETTSPEAETASLPDWYTAVAEPASTDAPQPVAEASSTDLLPEWFAQPVGQDGPLPEGPAACSPPGDLDLQLTVPPYTVSRGNVTGDVYTATVTNNNTVSTTTQVSLLINPNQGFYYLDNSATVTSNISGTLPYTDEGTTLPNASFTLAVSGTLTETSLLPGETMTFTFVLATDAGAQSAQPLAITLQSGSPPTETCLTSQENVQTARGNLTILKSPSTQNGSVGDEISWVVTLANSGLGNVYDAIFTDTIGAGYTNMSISPTPDFIDLAPNAAQQYTVTAVITACANLTNTVAANWSIGNNDATATAANPIEDEVDVALLLNDPDISIEIPTLMPGDFCGSVDMTRTITVTNNGGSGTNLRLNLSTNLNTTSLSPDWSLNGSTLTYNGGIPSGTIRSGEVLTFSVRLQGGPYCALNSSASLSVTPISEDGCQILTFTGTPASSSATMAPTAPTLNISKTGPGSIVAGDTFNYNVTISGSNQETIGPGGIAITDTLSSQVIVNSITPSAGSIITSGNQVYWSLPVTDTGSYLENLQINVTVPEEGAGVCNAGSRISNNVTAVADVCPECSLTGSAGTSAYVDDHLGTNNTFSKSATPIETCGDTNLQQITAILDIQDGVDWSQTTYTDPLGQGQFALPLNVIPGSVNVEIDGVDRTADITTTLGAPLVLDFANVGTISTTAQVTITYNVEAVAGSIVGDGATQSAYIFSEISLGTTSACSPSGSIGYLGATVTINRGNLGVGITPSTLTGCTEHNMTLTVSGGNVYQTDNIEVVFTADPTDIFTTTAGVVTYGGAFAGQTPTVTRVGNVVTFTFPTTLDVNSSGTINFPLFRNCGVSSPLSAQLTYQDRCDINRGGSASVNSTLHPELSLFVTPDRFTVNERVAPWRFYVTNTGTGTAYDTVVTNTLPIGYYLTNHVITSTTASTAQINAVTITTATLANGRQVITATIPALSAAKRLQFDMTSELSACTPVSNVDIALYNDCSAVTGVCGGRQTDTVTFIKGTPALVSSNIQPAALPLCEIGPVDLVVKNASATADLYDFTITDYLTRATYVNGTAYATVYNRGQIVNSTDGTPFVNIPFTPTIQTFTDSQLLSWAITDFTPGTLPYEIMAQRDASDEIHVVFDVLASCNSQGATVQSAGSAEDVCGTALSFTENSLTLTTDEPDLSAVKTVRNVSEGTAASGQTFAGVGDTLVWEIDITNSGTQRVTNLFVDDQMPDGFTIQSVSPITSSQTGNPPFLRWHETGGHILNTNTTATYLITTTVDADVCALDTTNTALASYACSTTDICLSIPVTSTAQINTKPTFSINPIDTILDQCGGGPIRIDFPNSGARAENVVLTYTLPAGLVYDGLATGTTPTPDTQPALGASGNLTFTYNVIGSQSSTNNLQINVINQSGVCIPAGPTPNNTADLSYTDTCGQPFDDVTAGSNTLTIQRSDISTASQTPLTRTIEANQTYTWTLTIPNTGTGATNNMVVTETLGVGWTSISASPASPSGTVPAINGNVITWNTDRLEAGQTWTAVFTATSVDAATDYRTTLNITTACDDNGCLQTNDNPTYNTPLQSFAKGIEQTPVSIGESFSYTITADFWGERQFSNVVLTDTLPTLGGTQVFSPTSVTFANENGGNIWIAGPLTGSVLTLTTSTPAAGQVDGPDFVTITVNGVISNEINANNNDIFTNDITLNYTEDGQDYTYTDSITGTIREPLLAITKTADPTTNLAAGDEITYTITVRQQPASTAVAYDVIITDVIPAELTYKAASLDAPGASVIATSDQLITITYNSLAVGSTAVLTYVATADTAVNLSGSYTNTATLTYTSTPGDNPAERIGTGVAPDDHIDSDNSTVGIIGPALSKATTATSLADTTGLNVAVGEIITYAVTLTMPQGTMPASILTDTLDAGLAFVSCSSIVAPVDVTASANFATVCANPSVTNQGGTVAFDFGTITNANLNDTTTETIVVTYQAVVVNDTNTNRDSTHNNSVVWAWNNGSRTANAANATVVEPTLTVAKTVDPGIGDAADIFTFTLSVAHAGISNAAAYDAIIADTIPTGMTYASGTLAYVSGPSVITEAAGSALTVTIPALLPGQTSIVQFQASLNTAIRPGDITTNTANLSWTSLPGDVTTPQSAYNTQSTERTGNTADPGGAVNDYRASDTASVEMTSFAAMTKSLTATSLGDTVTPNVAIGEIVTYTVQLQVPEGTMNQAVLTDTLDPGLAIVDIITITAPIDITTSMGSFDDVLATSRAGLASPGQQAAYTFGTVVNNNTDNAATEYIDVVYQAVVINSTANNRGGTRNNTAVFTWDTGSDSATTTNVVIVEPTLNITKTVSPTGGDAGDTITFTLTVDHVTASNSVAYDLVISDTIPAGMTYVPGSLVDVSGTAATSLTHNAGLITAQWDSLPTTGTSTIQFQVTLDTAVQPGDTFTNAANLTWTSLPGDVTTAQSAYDIRSTERTGDTADPGFAANDHTTSDTAPVVTMTNYPNVTKAIIGTNLADSSGLNVAIGEIITYQVAITVPEGTLNTALLTDTLPAGLAAVSVTDISASANVATSIGTFADVRAAANAALTSPGDELAFDFGNLTNSNTDNATAETITVTYETVVLNTTGNNRGDTRVNAIDFTWATGSDSAAANAVTIIEPTLTIAKTTAPTTGDAGDTITFTLTVDHATASNSTAYDLVISDTIPAGMTYVPGSLVDVSGTAATSLTHNAGLITAQWDSLPTTGTSTIQFQVTLDTAVQPGDTFTNAANLTWTSLPGDVTTPQSSVNTDSIERTGTGVAPDDYTTSDTAPVVTMTNYPNVTKAIIGTNLADSSGLNVAIGEIITYQVAITVPEGTLNTALLTDTLPAGLAAVSVTDISASANVATSIGTFADVRAAANAALTSPGDELAFDFGNLTNSNTDNTAAETITVTYETVVLNTTGNNRGNTRINAVDFTWATGSDSAAANAVTIIEPELTLTKTAVPTTGDAGDTITFTLVIDHATASDSVAYNTILTDAIPTGMTYVNGSFEDVSGTAATSLIENNGTLTATWDALTTAQASTIRFRVTLDESTQPGETITNNARLSWTSLPGDVTTPQSGVNTASIERTGTGIAPNDHTTSASDSITLNTPATIKLQPTPTQYTIGDAITYNIMVTLTEGTIQDMVVFDNLPDGLAYQSHTIITTTTATGSLLTAGYNGSVLSPTLTNAGGSGDNVTLNFGTITTTGDNDATNNTYQVQITAVVLNDNVNQQGDTLTNSAELRYTDANTSPQTVSGGSVNITIIEPQITTVKTVTPTTGVEAGDTVTYTVTVTNTGDSPAYDVTAVDTLAQGVNFGTLDSCTTAGAISDGGTTLSLDGSPAGSWDIAIGGSVTCIYTAVAQPELFLNGTHTNTIDADWSSQDGTTNTQERSYTDTGTHDVDVDQDVDTAVFSADAITFVKTDSTATATLGDTVFYTLTVSAPLGTLRNLVVEDVLPTGLIYNSDQAVAGISTVPTVTVSTSNDGSAPVTLNWDFDDAIVTSNTAVLTYSATVANALSSQQGDVLTNTATLTYNNAQNLAQTPLTDAENITIIEPQITTVKTVTPTTGVEAGDTVTYTVTVTNTGDSPAYDVTAVDTLAQGVNFGTLDSCTTAGAISDGGTTLSLDGSPAGSWDIAIGGSVTCIYTAVAQPELFLNGTHTNTIDADWSSQDGTTNTQERSYTDTGTHDVDIDQDVDTAVFSADAITFVKTDSTATATLGDTVFYTLTVSAPLGTLRNLVVEDVLPTGLIYNSDQAVAGISTVPTVTVSTSNDGSAPVTLNWDFDDAIVTSNTAVLTYSATVANVLSSQQGDVLTNTATLTYNNAQNLAQTPLTDAENITIIEPVLTIAKTIATPATPPDAGGTVIYQIIVQHDASSDMDAYDVVISDTLPTTMVNARSVNVTATGITAPSSEAISDIVRIPATGDGTFDLPQSAVVTITFAADIAGTILPNQIITNTAHTAWTTQNGTANTNERTSGDGFLNDGTLNDYEVTSDGDFTASGSSVGKSLVTTSAAHTGGSNVTIGEIITYAIGANLPEGIIPTLVITDNLPLGLVYTGDYAIDTTGFNGAISVGNPSVSPAGIGSSGQDVVFTFSQPITVTGDNDVTNNTFTITLRARALDIQGNDGLPPQTTLTNNATLQIGSGAPETSPDVTVTIVEPQLVIDKQFSPTAASTDDTITVTLTVTNTGTSNAYDVVISDPLSTYFTNISEAATATGFTYALVGNNVGYSDGTINVGQTVTFTFTAVLTTTVFDGLTIPNTVTVTQATTLPGVDSNERNEPEVQASDTLTVLAPDLAVTKDDGTTTTGPGDVLTYTLTITNNGTYTATGVVLTDTIPLNTSLVDGNGAAVSGRNLTWNLSPLGAGDVVTRAVSVQVDDPLTFGVDTITNTTGVADDGAHGVDPTPADNSDSDSDTMIAADLSLLKAVNNTTPNYGDIVTFTLTLANAGPNTATGVTISDTLPTGLTFITSTTTSGSYDDGTNLWTVGTIGVGNTAVLTLTTQVTATGAITNSARVETSDQYDPDSTPGNDVPGEDDQDDAVLNVPPAADLSLTKSINDAQANVGDTITYTLTLTNDGPDPASGVTVSDTLPAGLSFVTASSTPGTSYASSTWTIGDLAVSAQVTLTIQATVDSNGVFDNIARVETANEYDIDSTPGNDAPSEDDQDNAVLDTPEIDLSLTKTVNNATPNVGDTITYTLAVANAGPDDATGVTVSDTLPAGLTFITATTASGSYDDATSVWTIGAIAASGSASLQIAATVDSNGTFTNTAWVQTAVQFDTDSTPGDNDSGQDDQDDAIITTQEADLSLTKAVNTATPNYADVITFTLTLTNAGPDAATNVTVRDVLPTGLSYQNSSASQGSYDNGTSLWTVGTIANGTTAVLTLTTQVSATGAITNSTRVETSDQYDPNSTPGNDVPGEDDQDSVGITVPAAADLSLTKIVNDTAPNVGDTAVFTLTLTNNGPDTATGVTVTDTLPSGLTYVTSSATVGGYDSGTDLWTLAAPLASGSSATLVITATIDQSGSFTNSAQVQTATEYDPDSTPGNDASGEDDQDSATLTTQLIDLSLTKTVNDATPNLNDDVDFVITVVNDGPDTATSVTVSDTLPIGLVYQSSSADTGSYNSGSSIWNIGTLGNGATAVLTITARVTTTSTVTNTAWVQAADQHDGDSTPGDNDSGQDDQDSAIVTTELIDLSLTKAVNTTTPDYGDTITYTLTLTNAGPSNATGVTVSDTLPTGLIYQGSSADLGSFNNTTSLWTVGTLNANATAVLTITTQVSATGAIVNSTQVQTATEYDSDSTPGDGSTTDDDDDSVTITVGGSADLSLTKIVDEANPNVGDTVTFTITLSNDGPDTATGVTVTDTLPAGLSYVGYSASPGTTYDGASLWDVGTLNVGSQVTLTLQATLTAAGTHTNVAAVETSDQHDIDSTPGNDVGSEDDQDTAVVTTQQADLSLTKSLLTTGPYNVADVITYTIAITNAGPDAATGVAVSETLPAGLTYQRHTASQGTYTPGGSWDVGTLALNASSTLTLVVQITDSGLLTNTAAISAADQFDPDSTPGDGSTTDDDDDSVTITVAGTTTDLGDLPDSYGTLIASGGARHVISSLYLGGSVDAESDGQPGANADGDDTTTSDDENGVTRNPDFWVPNADVTLAITVTGGNGRLLGWIDWNGSGDFDASEATDFGQLAAGGHTVTLTVPADYTTGTALYARFRLFDPNNLPGGSLTAASGGLVSGGEVEDYYWTFSGATNITLQDFSAVPDTAVTLWWLWLLLPLSLAALGWRRRQIDNR